MLLAVTFEMAIVVKSIRGCAVIGGEKKVMCELVGEMLV